eukprot:1189731-Prorocentrum_minimum.AAC.2
MISRVTSKVTSGDSCRRGHRVWQALFLPNLSVNFTASVAEGEGVKAAEDSGHASSHVVCNVTGPCVPCSTAEKEEDWSVCENTGYRQPITCLLLPANPQEQQTEQQQEEAALEQVAPARAPSARKSRKQGGRKLFETKEAELTNQDDNTLDGSKKGSLPLAQTVFKVEATVEDLAGSGKEDEEQEVLVPAALLREDGEVKHTRLHQIAALIPGKWRRRLFFDAKAGRKTERRFETFQSCSLESAKGSNESISVLVFEGVMFGLLCVSIPVVYMRRSQGIVRRV